MSPEVIAAFIGAVGAIIIAVLGSFGAKRMGIGVNQERLVGILKDTVSAQTGKISELEKKDLEKDQKIADQDKEIAELKELTVNQAKRIDDLTRKVEELTKRRPRTPRASIGN